MKNLLFLMFFGALLYTIPNAQAQTGPQLATQLQVLNHYGQVMRKSPTQQGKVGSEMMFDEWRPVLVKLTDTVVEFSTVNLNLQNGTVEVLFQGEEKMILNKDFEYVTFMDQGRQKTFFSTYKMRHKGNPVFGLGEIVGDGAETVLVLHHIYVKAPNPNSHIVGGHQTDKLMKTTSLYIKREGVLTQVKSKSDLKAYYRNKVAVLNKYLKANKPDLKDPQGLYGVVEAMNKL